MIFDAGSPDKVKALYLTAVAVDLNLAAVLPHQVHTLDKSFLNGVLWSHVLKLICEHIVNILYHIVSYFSSSEIVKY